MTNVEIDEKKNYFYRDQFRRMMKYLVILLCVTVFLLLNLVFLLWTSPPTKFYASTTTGEVVPIQSLDTPVVTLPFIEQWAGTVVRSAYTLDFLSATAQLEKAKKYFTPNGWAQFENALQDSKFLKTVIDAKLQLSTIVNGPIVVVNRYVDHGRYTWVVQVPLLVLYTSASEQQKRQFYVTLTIKRVSELSIAQGIAVTNFISHGAL